MNEWTNERAKHKMRGVSSHFISSHLIYLSHSHTWNVSKYTYKCVLTLAYSVDNAFAFHVAIRRWVGNMCYWCIRCVADSSPSPWSSPACERTAAGCVYALRAVAASARSSARATDDDDSRWGESSGEVQTCPSHHHCRCRCRNRCRRSLLRLDSLARSLCDVYVWV